jgi:hypothetical protein
LKKNILYLLILLTTANAQAQKIDSIYINLYTDSLKKGTYNYINVDGLLDNGRYLPLDSTHLLFEASAGRFVGNSLWLDRNFTEEKVHIKVSLKKEKTMYREFDVFVKKTEDATPLKTANQVMDDIQKGRKKKKKN